ncbi:hypothetical protein Tco_0445173 [Tanacetum coccineum]
MHSRTPRVFADLAGLLLTDGIRAFGYREVEMSPLDHKKFCLGVARATGRRSFTDPKTGIWIPPSMIKQEDEEPNKGQSMMLWRFTVSNSPVRNEMAPTHRSGPNNNENPDIAAIIAQQLQTILPQIVTQVANQVNANGGNGGNGGNNRFSYKGFMTCNPKEYDGKGGFDLVEHPSSSKRSRSCDRYRSWTDFKALLVEEFCPSN